MSTTIPCKARDPRTCPYHGAEIKAKEAVDRGDFDMAFKWLQERDEAKKTSWEVLDFLEEQEKQGEPYTPGRYPYTYAADQLRLQPGLIPQDIAAKYFGTLPKDATAADRIAHANALLSRSQSSQIRQEMAVRLGIDDQELAFQLAEAYMHDNNITPAETRAQAITRMEQDRNTHNLKYKIMRAQTDVPNRIQAWEATGVYPNPDNNLATGIDRLTQQQAAHTMLANAELTRSRSNPNAEAVRTVDRTELLQALAVHEYGDLEDLGYYKDENGAFGYEADPGALVIDETHADELNATEAAWHRTRNAIDKAIVEGSIIDYDINNQPIGAYIDVVQALKNLDELYYTEG